MMRLQPSRSHGIQRRNRVGFTLVELLVVIAIIGILVALLLPAVQAAREAARLLQCKNNLGQMGKAALLYENANGHLPYGWNREASVAARGAGWHAELLPFMERTALYDVFDELSGSGAVWQAGEGERLCSTLISDFRCPSTEEPVVGTQGLSNVEGRVPSSYNACASSIAVTDGQLGGLRQGDLSNNEKATVGLFFGDSETRIAQITDGTSKTIAIGEKKSDHQNTPNSNSFDFWYIGSPQIGSGSNGNEFSEFVATTASPINLELNATLTNDLEVETSFGSWHPAGGAQFVFGDGSVRYLQENIERELYTALGSRGNGSDRETPSEPIEGNPFGGGGGDNPFGGGGGGNPFGS